MMLAFPKPDAEAMRKLADVWDRVDRLRALNLPETPQQGQAVHRRANWMRKQGWTPRFAMELAIKEWRRGQLPDNPDLYSGPVRNLWR